MFYYLTFFLQFITCFPCSWAPGLVTGLLCPLICQGFLTDAAVSTWGTLLLCLVFILNWNIPSKRCSWSHCLPGWGRGEGRSVVGPFSFAFTFFTSLSTDYKFFFSVSFFISALPDRLWDFLSNSVRSVFSTRLYILHYLACRKWSVIKVEWLKVGIITYFFSW